MSKRYKVNNKKNEEIENTSLEHEGLSKKEIYDLNKKKKDDLKYKNSKTKKKSKKNVSKKHSTNIAAKVFAIFMLLLMIGSVVASVASYIR